LLILVAAPSVHAQAGDTPPPAEHADGIVAIGDSVSIAVSEVPLAVVLEDLARAFDMVLAYSSATEARVTARWAGRSLEEALNLLLAGTTLTWKREGGVVVVADRQLPGMVGTRLIPLQHVPAGGLVERVPPALRQYAAIELVQEQNAIVVTGPADVLSAVAAFVHEVDRPVQQLLLEVLVVEFETSGLRRLGVTFLGGLLPSDADVPTGPERGWHTYLFGAGADQRGGLDVVGDGAGLNRLVNFWSELLGIRSIGRLPTDFHLRLQALEHAGRAEVRSRPHIATLNGHTANITVGTSQYYLLRSVLPYAAGGVFGGEEVEHFEYVQADVRLDITPWVTGDGGVTAVIRPSFTTPVGPFDPRVPPALQRWSVDTSVRLRDGETFMIGGLIQQRSVDAENRVPLLGRLPIVGRLFRNAERRRGTSELVIFITPHVLNVDGTPSAAEAADRRSLLDESAPDRRSW
jgi:type IV pilus assembly protein PilQ